MELIAKTVSFCRIINYQLNIHLHLFLISSEYVPVTNHTVNIDARKLTERNPFTLVLILRLFWLDIDECSPNPCQNSGVCTDLVNGFNCTCTAGYTGATCRPGNTVSCDRHEARVYSFLHFVKKIQSTFSLSPIFYVSPVIYVNLIIFVSSISYVSPITSVNPIICVSPIIYAGPIIYVSPFTRIPLSTAATLSIAVKSSTSNSLFIHISVIFIKLHYIKHSSLSIPLSMTSSLPVSSRCTWRRL